MASGGYQRLGQGDNNNNSSSRSNGDGVGLFASIASGPSKENDPFYILSKKTNTTQHKLIADMTVWRRMLQDSNTAQNR